jgi:hypothetical protein
MEGKDNENDVTKNIAFFWKLSLNSELKPLRRYLAVVNKFGLENKREKTAQY